MKFSHLHVHTEYSLLDGASSVKSILKKAVKDQMPAVAITDHGNLFGVFEFVMEAYKMASSSTQAIKPIIGCEFYLTQDTTIKDKSTRFYHQLLLAKNETGYQNLLKLSQLSYVDGFYRKPCIDKKMILQYHEGLIATSCCLASMVARTLHEGGEEKAEEELKWWMDVFQDDYYLELQRHSLTEQDRLNAFLVRMAKKYNRKLICTNDSHYTEESFAPLHEILLCINTGSFMSEPKKTDEDSAEQSATDAQGKRIKYRFGFPNEKFFFKTTAEMEKLFVDVPEALDNTNEIVDKVTPLNLTRDILLPNYDLPAGFQSQNDYLRHLAYEGLKKKYNPITPEAEERLQFELDVIEKMDYCGYFLIVADFIKAAKDSGIAVGPGRGSAAGSLVAYLMGITNIDPIKYQLLFERFLNPERRGMPDIDIDFDDIGRSRVIDYIVQKYGKNRTAQIVTFNTMGAKSALKDVARVLEYDYGETNQLSKLLNSHISIQRQIEVALENSEDSLEKTDKLSQKEIDTLKKLREIYNTKPEVKKIIDYAKGLDGSVRNVGVHAAGIIITPRDVETMIPVCSVKGSEMMVTQIEGKYIEEAGVIKMDILGLSNLSTIQKCIELIRKRHQTHIDIDNIPLNDEATYALYQRGETVGTFQFESDGMRKYLRDLKPDRFEDLIALNALYRPGPMRYIPEYILRKQGQKKIIYDLPEVEQVLKETYGITVYQEQVMLLAQILAGFSKGEADVLRKAMGKKKREELEKMKQKFMEGAKAKNHPEDILQKIWNDWESFAQYAFNKSHSTCYALVAYQTAYLKANYPHEYVTSLLEGTKDIKEQAKIIEEAKRMGINILGPSVNESEVGFSITADKAIRFGLSAIKGLGEKDSETIVSLREDGKPFDDVFHLMRSIGGSLGSGKIESLVKAGALDCFSELKRSQYLYKMSAKGETFIDSLVQYAKASVAQTHEKSSLQLSFDLTTGGDELAQVPIPKLPPDNSHETNELEMLKQEKEALGTYISKHPLSMFQFEFDQFSFIPLIEFAQIDDFENIDDEKFDHKTLTSSKFLMGGIVESVVTKTTKRGMPYISLTLNDFSSTHTFTFFGMDMKLVESIARQDAYIYLQIGYRADRFNPEKLRQYIAKAGMLETFRKEHVKEIHLYVKQEHLSQPNVDYLSKYIPTHSNGNTQLFLHLSGGEEGDFAVKIDHKIIVEDDLIAFVQSQPHIYCKASSAI